MATEIILERAHLAAAVMLTLIGVITVLASGNAAKRLAGIVAAMTGAMLALGVLGAPASALAAGVAVTFAQLVIGVALLVRMQESYGGAEIAELDAADAQAEKAEPSA